MANTDLLYLDFLLDYKKYFDIQESCTEGEVNGIEAGLKVKFPRAYRELYLLLGKKRAFRIAPENGYKFPEYKEMQAGAKEITDSNGITLDYDNIFVFVVFEENAVISFFRLDEGDDPPVYEYEGGSEEPEQVTAHFSDYIKRMGWYEGFVLLKRDKDAGRL
jgi:hypothetical protein